MAQVIATLHEISPDKIRPNPDNPRLVFHEEEMVQLMESIREVGIKVPISLYAVGKSFVLIDGERRWRSAKRLNLPVIPAIVQPKPTKLENLLMMFNIHNVRVDWDPMPMARKLKEVRELLEKEGKSANVKALSAVTGVPIASVRRGLELLELPQRYQNMLIKEAQKPRSEQKITADLFIEINKSLHVVERHAPEVFEEVSKPEYISTMVKKYANGVIDNVVAYREVSKIARAELAGVSKREAVPAIVNLVKTKNYSIKDAYQDTVQTAYEQRDLLTRLQGIVEKLTELKAGVSINDEMKDVLRKVRSQIDRLLGE